MFNGRRITSWWDLVAGVGESTRKTVFQYERRKLCQKITRSSKVCGLCSGSALCSGKIFATTKKLIIGSKQNGKGKQNDSRKVLMIWNIEGIWNKQQEVFKELNYRKVGIVLSETMKKAQSVRDRNTILIISAALIRVKELNVGFL